jgi:hypothetical protein
LARAKLQNLVGKVILSVQIVQVEMGNAMVFKVQDVGQGKIYHVYVETGGWPDENNYNRAEVVENTVDEFNDFMREVEIPDSFTHDNEERDNKDPFIEALRQGSGNPRVFDQLIVRTHRQIEDHDQLTADAQQHAPEVKICGASIGVIGHVCMKRTDGGRCSLHQSAQTPEKCSNNIGSRCTFIELDGNRCPRYSETEESFAKCDIHKPKMPAVAPKTKPNILDRLEEIKEGFNNSPPPQCTAVTKRDERCIRKASEGMSTCKMHAPLREEDKRPVTSLETLVEGKQGIFRSEIQGIQASQCTAKTAKGENCTRKVVPGENDTCKMHTATPVRMCFMGIGPGSLCPKEALPNQDYCEAHVQEIWKERLDRNWPQEHANADSLEKHAERLRVEKMLEEDFEKAAKRDGFWDEFCDEIADHSIFIDVGVSEALESWRWCELGGDPQMQFRLNDEYAKGLHEFEINFLRTHAHLIPARLIGAELCSEAASEIVYKDDNTCFKDFLTSVGVNTNIN